jgi:hypothetical protein
MFQGIGLSSDPGSRLSFGGILTDWMFLSFGLFFPWNKWKRSIAKRNNLAPTTHTPNSRAQPYSITLIRLGT